MSVEHTLPSVGTLVLIFLKLKARGRVFVPAADDTPPRCLRFLGASIDGLFIG